MKTTLFKFIYYLGLARVLKVNKKGCLTILSLHRISNEKDFFFNPISPKLFEKLIVYLRKNYTIISFENLNDLQLIDSKPPVILSFDDGYYDFYEFALPILIKYKVPCNHNVVNDCVNNNTIIWTQRLNAIFNHCRNNNIDLLFETMDKTFSFKNEGLSWMIFYIKMFHFFLETSTEERMSLIKLKEDELSIESNYRMMNWAEIIECSNNLVEIGSHTFSHNVLSTISDENILRFEILNSKQEIEEKINKKVKVLALPNGQGNQLINDICKLSGFNYLLYVNDEINDLKNVKNTNFVKFNRISLVEESYPEMVLRTELFHSKIRKYV